MTIRVSRVDGKTVCDFACNKKTVTPILRTTLEIHPLKPHNLDSYPKTITSYKCTLITHVQLPVYIMKET